MKKYTVLASLLLMAASPWASAADPIRIATEGAYPPFNSQNADGELVGFDVDIAKRLCEQMKRECEIVAQDWDGIIPALTNNKYDAIVASMSITQERSQVIDFTDPYYSNYLSVIGKSDTNVEFDTLDTVTVGAQRSTTGSTWAEETLGRRGKIKLYDTNPAALSDLQAGRIEAVISDYLPAAEWLQANTEYSFIEEKIDLNDKIGIGIRKGEEDLVEAFNAALKSIREDGSYTEISMKYFGVDIY